MHRHRHGQRQPQPPPGVAPQRADQRQRQQDARPEQQQQVIPCAGQRPHRPQREIRRRVLAPQRQQRQPQPGDDEQVHPGVRPRVAPEVNHRRVQAPQQRPRPRPAPQPQLPAQQIKQHDAGRGDHHRQPYQRARPVAGERHPALGQQKIQRRVPLAQPLADQILGGHPDHPRRRQFVRIHVLVAQLVERKSGKRCQDEEHWQPSAHPGPHAAARGGARFRRGGRPICRWFAAGCRAAGRERIWFG
ncbi:MAG: hypothetical protein BWZ08_02353 [candidate division BRC1 bacterium ADurb.BinA292]|nr:MAG: hypothetical protein BWZ08_02353 [candidate division BRC1 bacterium ADurb.BinA292]